MFFLLHTMVMLALESNRVIGLRLVKLAGGGSDAQHEAQRMVSEKVDASIEAGVMLMQGGDMLLVVERLRQHVSANIDRLSFPDGTEQSIKLAPGAMRGPEGPAEASDAASSMPASPAGLSLQ